MDTIIIEKKSTDPNRLSKARIYMLSRDLLDQMPDCDITFLERSSMSILRSRLKDLFHQKKPKANKITGKESDC